MSSDPEQEYFSDGISEELLNLLTKIPELRVTSRSSAFSFKGKHLELPEIARRLDVAHILEGSVRKSGNKVRITAQLIDMRSDTHLWSSTWDREMTDIFAVQDEIAGAVVEQLKVELLGTAPKTRATDPQAYALYLQARQLGRQFTAASWIQSNALYEEALRLDPGYAAALDGIATNYINQASTGQMPSEEAYRLAREYVARELAIDPDYALAHDNLGWLAMAYDLDMAAAVGHFQRAMALEPGNIDVIGHAGVLVYALGRLEQSIAILEYNIARDPVSLSNISNLADIYLQAGREDDAIRLMNTVLNLSPDRIGASAARGIMLLYKGDTDAALASVSAEADEIARLLGVAQVQHARGNAAESDAALEQAIAGHAANVPYEIAQVFAYRGDADQAFEWLERAAAARDPGLIALPTARELDSLRTDPRWLPFLRKLRMAPEQLDPIAFDVALPD